MAGCLLDTCTWLWLVSDQHRLSDVATRKIREQATALHVSAISAFEIGVKHARGKLQLPLEPAEWVAKALELHGLAEIPVDSRIAVRATQLPRLHNDPCDRLILATAALQGLAILTPDPFIRAYPGAIVLW